jgi:hypothetical protein
MNDKVVIYREEYERLLKEHELLAILRSYGVEQWEYWDKAINVLKEEEQKNGNS